MGYYKRIILMHRYFDSVSEKYSKIKFFLPLKDQSCFSSNSFSMTLCKVYSEKLNE